MRFTNESPLCACLPGRVEKGQEHVRPGGVRSCPTLIFDKKQIEKKEERKRKKEHDYDYVNVNLQELLMLFFFLLCVGFIVYFM